MATDIRRRFRRPKESSSELVWEDPESSVSCSSSQLRNHDAQKERRGESPMRRGYVPLSARTPRPVRSLLSVHRSPSTRPWCTSPDPRCQYVSSTARRQCGCYPSPGCLRAAAHRHRRSTGIDLIHAGSKELRSIVYGHTWVSVWGAGTIPAPAVQTKTMCTADTCRDTRLCRVGKERKRSAR